MDDEKTKREVFAALAMQGMLSCPTTDGMSLQKIAETSVNAADALIAELSKPADG